MNLCLTLAEESLLRLREKIDRYQDQVRFIEVRLDYLKVPGLPELPSASSTEFIATCRPAREGGVFQGSEEDRLRLLRQAAESGFRWIDLEHDVATDLPFPDSVGVVRSYHCFAGFPENLEGLFGRVRERGGTITKLAVTVGGTEELVALLRFMESIPGTVPHIIIGMGPFGQPSRLLGFFLGNYWTYVAETEQDPPAPGQFPLTQAVDWYRFNSWKSAPFIYGVLGNPVAHSMSPWIHNVLFQHYGLKKVYFPFQLDRLDPWFQYIDASQLSFHGFSVTLPFKSEVVKLVRICESPLASLNTLLRKGSWWEGINTDWAGFLRPLASRISLKGKTAVVLGNGGVAHTVVAALQTEGAEVVVVGRKPEKVEDFAARYGCRHALFSDLPVRADLCVNTTPVGQHPQVDVSPLREDQLNFHCVYDLVYRPEKTRLLAMAERKGIETISGLEMFIEQAALQFQAWTRIDPDRDMMREMMMEP